MFPYVIMFRVVYARSLIKIEPIEIVEERILGAPGGTSVKLGEYAGYWLQGLAPARVSGFKSRLRHDNTSPSLIKGIHRFLFLNQLTPLQTSGLAELSRICRANTQLPTV